MLAAVAYGGQRSLAPGAPESKGADMKCVNAASIILLHNEEMDPDAIISAAYSYNWTEHAIDPNWNRPYGALHRYAEFEFRRANRYGLSNYGRLKAHFLVGALALLWDAESPMTADAVSWEVHEKLGVAANPQWFDDLRSDRLVRKAGEGYALTAHGKAVAERAMQWFPAICSSLQMYSSVVIEAYGVRWRRDGVDWRGENTRMYGMIPPGGAPVEIGYNGIYALYRKGAAQPVYVGQTLHQLLAARLAQHHRSADKRDKWDEFSWFGVMSAGSSPAQLNTIDLINALEAVLIEVIKPADNKSSGLLLGECYAQYSGGAIPGIGV